MGSLIALWAGQVSTHKVWKRILWASYFLPSIVRMLSISMSLVPEKFPLIFYTLKCDFFPLLSLRTDTWNKDNNECHIQYSLKTLGMFHIPTCKTSLIPESVSMWRPANGGMGAGFFSIGGKRDSLFIW